MLKQTRDVREEAVARFRLRNAAGVWGEGLADLSLATLWRPPVRWSDVSDDEIVFLIPALAARPLPSDGARPAMLVRQALAASADRAARALMAAGFATQETAAAAIVARTLAVEASDRSQIDGEAAVDRAWQPYVSLLPAFMILAVLEEMLCHLAPAGGARAEQKPALSLADLLVGAVHARFNGAYGHPRLAFAHELLTAGAWIGQVLAGRPALMPVGIAGCLLDVLTRNDGDRAGVEQVLLTYYAEAAGGVDRFVALSRRVVKGGRPQLMPGAARAYDLSHHPVWDVPLARSLLGALQRAI